MNTFWAGVFSTSQQGVTRAKQCPSAPHFSGGSYAKGAVAGGSPPMARPLLVTCLVVVAITCCVSLSPPPFCHDKGGRRLVGWLFGSLLHFAAAVVRSPAQSPSTPIALKLRPIPQTSTSSKVVCCLFTSPRPLPSLLPPFFSLIQ